MAEFVQQFAEALAKDGKDVSTCQGDPRCIAMLIKLSVFDTCGCEGWLHCRYTNTGLVNASNYRMIDMGSYTTSFKAFSQQLLYGAGHFGGKSNLAHFGVGMSADEPSWSRAPTDTELRERFDLIDLSGIKHVAIFGTRYIANYTKHLSMFLTQG